MSEKTVLIVDNEDQADEIEDIIRKGKTKGLKISCYQFNVGSTSRPDLLNDSHEIDLDKVISVFLEQFRGVSFNLIAFDWGLDDEKINGPELIRQFQFHGIRKSTPKILYSGLLKEHIVALLNRFKLQQITESSIMNELNTLIRTPIVDFVDRPEYGNAIVSVLQKHSDPLEFTIEKELRKLKDFEFKNAFPDFKGKKFGEIADVIEANHSAGNKFKTELINQIISYLTEINNDK